MTQSLTPQLGSNLKKVKETEDFEIYVYTPSLIRAFPFRMEKISAAYRLRCIQEYFVGYIVYYIRIGDQWAGYCAVSSGRNPRYFFSTRDDIIFGRCYISPAFRGKGLSKKLVRQVLDHLGLKYKKAYAFVHAGNTPSHALCCGIGCHVVGHFDKVGRLRQIRKNENGAYTIYCYQPLNNRE